MGKRLAIYKTKQTKNHVNKMKSYIQLYGNNKPPNYNRYTQKSKSDPNTMHQRWSSEKKMKEGKKRETYKTNN